MKKLVIILFALLVFQVSKAQQGLKAIEGKEGIWLFYSNQVLGANNPKGITATVISRSDEGGNWKEIGTATSTIDIAEMKKKFGSDFPAVTAAYLNLRDENSLVDYIRQHPSLEDYEFLVFDLYFMQTVGASYLDATKPSAGTKVKYRVQLKNKNGEQVGETGETEITIGAPLQFSALRYAGKSESDSAVSVKWIAVTKSKERFYFANVYRLSDEKGNYLPVGKVMANTNGDTTIFQWNEEAQPGGLYKYYLRPTNMVGLEGSPSDTIGAIAADFDKVPRFENFKSTDTAGGIFFSWTPLKADVLYSGIAVMRKPMSSNDYTALDTISTISSFYFDNQIIPNIVYQYEFRLVNLRWKPLAPSAAVTAMHRTGDRNQHVPFALKAEAVKEGLKVTWRKINHYDVNGYYVYRSVNGDEYKLQSQLLKDTSFTDDDATNGRTIYNYKISSLNFSDVESDKSNAVQAKPFNTIIPIAPKGIFVYHEAGKTTVQWNNTKNDDALITGYFVYRKAGTQEFNKLYTPDELKSAGFIKLNEKPVETPLFADVNVAAGKAFTYAVTSVDVNGAESNAEQFVEAVSAAVRIAAPSFFALNKSATGVMVSWDRELNTSVTDYVIYRRARNETTLQQVGTVKASQLSYTDTRAVAGTFYFYAIKAKSAGGESDFSLEKGIAR